MALKPDTYQYQPMWNGNNNNNYNYNSPYIGNQPQQNHGQNQHQFHNQQVAPSISPSTPSVATSQSPASVPAPLPIPVPQISLNVIRQYYDTVVRKIIKTNKPILIRSQDTLEYLEQIALSTHMLSIHKIPSSCTIELIINGRCLKDWAANGYTSIQHLRFRGNENVYIKTYNANNEYLIQRTDGDWMVYKTPTGRTQKKPVA